MTENATAPRIPGAIQVYESPESVRADIMSSLHAQIEEVLPSRMDADRFLRVATKAVIENPTLMTCTRLSLLSAIHTAAQLGLEPSGLLGSAYIVPYRRNVTVIQDGRTVTHSVMQAQLIPGYRGLIDLARRSGEIDAIQAEVVRFRDMFDYEPTRQPDPIRHRPFIPDPRDTPEERDRGPVVGVYMVATLRGGFCQPEWMTTDEVEAVRRSSKAASDGPWVTYWSEMARKTVVRRGSKYLPLTTDFRRALELDEEAERGAETPAPVTREMPRATRMLLERAAQRAAAPQDTTVVETSPDTIPEANEAPGPSEAVEGEVVEMPPPPATASDICGDENAELGICSRAPDHPASHRNEDGVWPRARKARK